MNVGPKHKELVQAMRANGVLLRDRSADPGCDGFVRITIGLEEHVTQGLSALKVSLDEIGWKKQEVGGSASQQVGDGVREFE
jgi:histidinol-phosphate aminotransferase